MAWSPTPNTKRLRSGAVAAAREATPMLLVLTVPLVIVLGLAMYAVSTVQPAAIPSPDPYPGFRLDRLGSDVRWLVDDGAGHRPQARNIAFEADGSVLLCCERPNFMFGDTMTSRLVRLGDSEPAARWELDTGDVRRSEAMAVADDGTVWAVGRSIASLNDGIWTVRRHKAHNNILEVLPDGTAWAVIETGLRSGSPRVVRVGEGRNRVYKAGNGLPKSAAWWGSRITGIAATPGGDVWVGVSGWHKREAGGLLRFDGRRWRVERPLGRKTSARVESLATAPDGTLWVYLSRTVPKGIESAQPDSYLARFDGRQWQVLHQDDGVPAYGARYARNDQGVLMAAGPGGVVWLTPKVSRQCRELVSFHEGVVRQYLPKGACIEDLELAPDGTAWVAVGWTIETDYDHRGEGIYLIDSPVETTTGN